MAINGASNGTPGGRPKRLDRGAIDLLEKELRGKRKGLTLWKDPIIVTRHFGALVSAWSRVGLHALATHPAMVFFAMPLLALWWCLEHVPGPYTAAIDEVEKYIKFVAWWVGLGVLSSVGLGTGMHTGVLFLFPHIMKVCLAAEECGTLAFEADSDMWLQEDESLFSCPEMDFTAGGVTFWPTFWKVYPACFLWGAGTAIGEIPPYAVSYAAKLAGEHVEELDELDSLGNNASVGRYEVMKRMKIWMINFLQRHGFVGVFLMSAWPNMAFDLCGICCGHSLMPFRTFFGATLLGKAGVKVTLQAMFFTMLFSERHLGSFVGLVRRFTPVSWGLGDLLLTALTQGKARFHRSRAAKEAAGKAGADATTAAAATKPGRRCGGRKAAESPAAAAATAAVGDASLGAKLALMWKFVMFGFVVLFAVSCIDQFAQRRAAELDAERIRRLKWEAEIDEGTGAAINTADVKKEQ